MEIEGISWKETWELSNRDDFKPLMRTVCAYADGVQVMLPKEIDGGWTMTERSHGLSSGVAAHCPDRPAHPPEAGSERSSTEPI